MSEGHPAARHYPLAHLWNETRFARRRVTARMKTQAVLMQAVVSSAFGDNEALKKALRRLGDGTE